MPYQRKKEPEPGQMKGLWAARRRDLWVGWGMEEELRASQRGTANGLHEGGDGGRGRVWSKV